MILNKKTPNKFEHFSAPGFARFFPVFTCRKLALCLLLISMVSKMLRDE